MTSPDPVSAPAPIVRPEHRGKTSNESKNEKLGILMAISATIFYALADTLSKYQARTYPVEMIVWARYTIPLLLMVAVFWPRQGWQMFRTVSPKIQCWRGLLLTGGTLLIVYAYRVMPIAEAQAIFFIHPVVLTLLAVAFLGERVSRLGWLAVVGGFCGVLVIVRPGGGLFTLAALMPICLAFSFSAYQILTRIVAGKDSPINSLSCVLLVGAMVTSVILPFVWVTPPATEWLLFAINGALSGLGYFSTIKALEFARASLLAPFAYVQLIWVSALGALVFGDFPGPMTLLGIVIVAISGLMVAMSRKEVQRVAGKTD